MFETERKMLSNGGRPLIASTLFLFGALALLGTALVYGLLVRDDPYHPLEDRSPAHVLSPVVGPQGPLLQEIVRCNHSDGPIAIQTILSVRNIETRELKLIMENYAVRDWHGCVLRASSFVLPALAPGMYRMEGVIIAQEGDQRQQEPWVSEPFVVERAE